MFFSDPAFDLKLSLNLLGLSAVIAIIIWAITRKKFLALVIFSVLGNLSFLINVFTSSEMFRVYGIAWLKYFSLLIWPIINIYLIINFIKNKNVKKENILML